jgi:hypothetical protein
MTPMTLKEFEKRVTTMPGYTPIPLAEYVALPKSEGMATPNDRLRIVLALSQREELIDELQAERRRSEKLREKVAELQGKFNRAKKGWVQTRPSMVGNQGEDDES